MVDEGQAVYNLNSKEVETWLLMLFGDTDGLVHVSASRDWAGQAYPISEIDKLVEYVRAHDDREGTYVRMTTLRAQPKDGGRGSEADSYEVVTLWSDLDIAGPNHKTTKVLPPDEQSARKIIAESGLPEPTLWITTGGGLHPYWLLYKPVEIVDQERVKGLSVAWQKIIAHAARQLGWFVDGTAVSDLARIMRIPGTVNRKNGGAQACTYGVGGSGQQFTLEELESAAYALLPAVIEAEEAARPKPVSAPRVEGAGGLTPGDDFNAKTAWADLLQPAGWRFAYRRGNREYWTRPGKDFGVSASTGGDADVLFVFSSSTQFTPWLSYTKFGAYAVMAHGGDHSEAARQLRRDGFGERQDLADRDARIIREIMGDDIVPPPTPGAAEAPKPRREYTLDDTGNAHRIRDQFGAHYRYVEAYNGWMSWNGKTWERDSSRRVYQAAEVCTELMLEQAKDMEEQAGDDEEKLERVKNFRRHIKTSRSDRGIKGAVSRFSQQRGIAIEPDDFDSAGHLVTVDNGVLDLRTGQLGPFDPKALLTRKLNSKFDPNAQCPKWMKFLEGVLPDENLRHYVQRAMAYTLLGEADRRAMFLLYGPSGTGKSQFIEALAHVFGDFATTAAASTFRKKHGNSTPTNDLHGLKGRRLISSSETSETSELDEELIKRFTGRDQVTSRDLYEKYQTWVPEGAVWLTTNYLPKLSSDDNAVWLRLKAIEFSQIFVNTDQDRPNIGVEIAREEAAGILNWLLAGVQLYREFGLEEPEKVKQSNADHRRESDNVSQFLEEAFDEGQIVREDGANTLKVSMLFDRYEHWCKRNHIAPLGIRRFNQRCSSQGLRKERRGGFYYWLGLKINDAYGLMGTMT